MACNAAPSEPPATLRATNAPSAAATTPALTTPTVTIAPRPRYAQVVAKIPLQLNEGIVVDGSIFADESHDVLRIDPATNTVVAILPLVRATFLARDGALWTLGPVGLVPGPDTSTIGRIDLATNTVVTIGQIPFATWFDVGLGAIWVSRREALDKLDATDGSPLASWPWPADLKGSVEHAYAVVACDALWASIVRSSSDPVSTTFEQLDPQTGKDLGTYSFSASATELANTDGECWSVMAAPSPALASWLARFEPGRGAVERSPILATHLRIIGDTFWTWTLTGVVQQIDPVTAAPIGDAWQIPDDLREGTWENLRLIAADGSLWVVTSGVLIEPEGALWRLDIPVRE